MIAAQTEHDYIDPALKDAGWGTDLGSTIVIFPGITITAKSNNTVNDAVKKGLIDAISDTVGEALIDIVKIVISLKEGATIDQIMDEIGKSNATVKRYLKILRIIKLIKFKGAAKTGKYFFTEQAKKKFKNLSKRR